MSPFLAWGDFHARSRFARSTIPEEKWGTTRSLEWLSFTNSLAAFSPQFMFTGQSFRLKGILPKWGKLGRFCGLEYVFFAKSERQTDNYV